MRINHGDAISLENIVRNVFNCDRGGMGGYIDADNFEGNPFDAALIALAPLWQNTDFHVIEDFLYKWDEILRGDKSEEVDIKLYVDELRDLVNSLKA